MILLFLRDLRSVIVVVSNIPLALLGSLFGLWVTGNTINIMSLGGMALAIGILVDEATVTIENMHVQMGRTPNIATAVLHAQQRHGRAAAAGLALHPVGVHPGVHHGRPAPVAVHAADPGGRLRHDLVVPALEHVRADHVRVPAQAHGSMARRSAGCSTGSSRSIARPWSWFVRLRWLVVPGYLAACGLVLWLLGLQVGTELFPQIDSGQFVLRFRPPPGSNFELTRQMAVKCLEEIEHEAKPENIEITMGFVGQVAPNFGIDNMVLFMRGPDDGQLRVALREDSGIKLDEFRERLRKVLPERVIPWLAERLEQGGLVQGGGAAASQDGDLRIRAGRHRDQGHELRLARRRSRSASSAPI